MKLSGRCTFFTPVTWGPDRPLGACILANEGICQVTNGNGGESRLDQIERILKETSEQGKEFDLRLREHSEAFRSGLKEENEAFRSGLKEQDEAFRRGLKEQDEALRTGLKEQDEAFRRRLKEQDEAFDRRINRLEERHEALTQSVELMHRDWQERQQKNEVLMAQALEMITSLVGVAQRHDRRLDRLEGR